MVAMGLIRLITSIFIHIQQLLPLLILSQNTNSIRNELNSSKAQYCDNGITYLPLENPNNNKTVFGEYSTPRSMFYNSNTETIATVNQDERNKLNTNVYNSAATELSPNHKLNTVNERDVIVHLFEWRWDDIAIECERFLGPKEYAAVQISPPNEHSVLWEPPWNKDIKRPWYERYRPVSYILETRSGNKEHFEEMVKRCNQVGVRIYVDLVINHMSYYKDEKCSTAGSDFDSRTSRYNAVPYESKHFNGFPKCSSLSGNIENFEDVNQLRNCRLLGLNDLDQSQSYVRNKILDYLSYLVDVGVAGFRVDAAKHMWPEDLKKIYEGLPNLNTSYFPPFSKAFIYQEVADMEEDPISWEEYIPLGKVTEFPYGVQLAAIFLNINGDNLTLLKTFGENGHFMPSRNALVFVDNHDTQRGHGVGENNRILTFRDGRKYFLALVFMLAWPYGTPSLMSSYDWPTNIVDGKDLNDWWGPPRDAKFNILPVSIAEDGSCLKGWICEHRKRSIYNMVALRNTAFNVPVGYWWENGANQIAFSRGDKAFVAINNDQLTMDVWLETGLPQGVYCDVVGGSIENGQCTGETVFVNEESMARITIHIDKDVPAIALHVRAKLEL